MLYYDFTIIYKKGKQNVGVDEILRKHEDTKELLCVFILCKQIG